MQFKEILQDHIDDYKEIRVRLNELLEFEVQWKDLFDKAAILLGCPATINLRETLTYTTYTMDKYHLLVSDLYSLLEGQLGKDDKKPILSSLETQIVINLNPYPDPSLDPDTYETKYLIKEKKEQALRLFPEISSDFKVTLLDVESLEKRMLEAKNHIKPLRHLYNHRYEQAAFKKYSQRHKAELEEIKKIVEWYGTVLNDISVLTSGISYGMDIPYKFEDVVKSAIDVMVFGSLEGFFFHNDISDKNLGLIRYNDPIGPKFYWQFRELFFKSEKFKEMLNPDTTQSKE